MSNKKILIVEDDADVRLGYQVLLRAHNYDTAFAADGSSVVSEARKFRPDLVILDLGLPAGDGFLVLERLRAHSFLDAVPILVVSAREVQPNKDRALAAGVKAFIQKPWNDDELLATISEQLGGAALPRPAIVR